MTTEAPCKSWLIFYCISLPTIDGLTGSQACAAPQLLWCWDRSLLPGLISMYYIMSFFFFPGCPFSTPCLDLEWGLQSCQRLSFGSLQVAEPPGLVIPTPPVGTGDRLSVWAQSCNWWTLINIWWTWAWEKVSQWAFRLFPRILEYCP